jgi:hypothetical protein
MDKKPLHLGPVYVKTSTIAGRGVFAAQRIEANTLIEECHTLKFELSDRTFYHYYFAGEGCLLLPLGYGVIYNSQLEPNATLTYDATRDLCVIKALKAIEADEEIFVSYGRDWFTQRKLEIIPSRPLPQFLKSLRGLPLRLSVASLSLLGAWHLLLRLAAP